MSDERKYRQRGYQDTDRGERAPRRTPGESPQARRPEREPGAPAGARRISSEGAKNPNMPGYRAVARCARCGALVDAQVFSRSKCNKCGQDLRSCAQCVNFNPSARFECTEQLTARVSPKDTANECQYFSARTTWEREASSAQSNSPAEPSGARKAFDDLFKF
jgi:hypothetical protein